MKCVFTFFVLLCAVHFAQAQETGYYDRMNQLFGAIDKTKVTTGYLKDFGVRINDVESYNGTMDSTNWVDVTQWQSLYRSLHSMRVGTAASSMVEPTAVSGMLKSIQASNTNVTLIAVQHYAYQQYKTTALTGGDVRIVNGRINDVAGRNPYETKIAFAATPMQHRLKGNTFSFQIQSNTIFTNSAVTLSSMQVDFGNGQGYQTLTINTPKSVTYASGGDKEMKVKFVYSNGLTLYSHSKLQVNYISPVAQARFDNSNVRRLTITGDLYQGASAIGDITIEYAGSDRVLDKPLIVVEGFDPDGSFAYEDLISGLSVGSLQVDLDPGAAFYSLNQAIEDEGFDLVFVDYRNGTDFLQRNAYMVEKVIQWVNANKVGEEKNVVLGMSMGGLVARYALRHMETTGLIHETRLYVSHDAPHQGANIPVAYQALVRHLVGESIGWPVFLGFFEINIVDLKDIAPALEDALNLLQTPAAQQMLIYQLQGTGGNTANTSNALYNSFATEYRSMGYPAQDGIRNIAISNGSECGTPLSFGPNATLAELNESIDLPFFVSNIVFSLVNFWTVNPIRSLTSFLSTDTDIKAKFTLRALPNQQVALVYKGRIYIRKEVLWAFTVEESIIGERTINSIASMLPMDNVAGGIYDINNFISNLPTMLSGFLKERRFNFVPTFSSLDISGGSQPITYSDLTRVYSPLGAPLPPKKSPFHNFFTNSSSSTDHIRFNLQNGNWLLDELQGTPGFYSCASSCTGLPDLPFDKTSPVCSGGTTYNLLNVSQQATVSWSVSPSKWVATAAGTGSSATLLPASAGTRNSISLTFSVNTGCGTPVKVTKSLWVGKPYVSVSYKDGEPTAYQPYPIPGDWDVVPAPIYNPVCNLIQTPVTASVSGATSKSWQKVMSSPSNISWSSSGDVLKFYLYGVGSTATFRHTATNGCGMTGMDFYFRSVTCGSGGGGGTDPCAQFQVSPNPTSTAINIVVPHIPAPCPDLPIISISQADAPTSLAKEAGITSVILLDSQGQVHYTREYSGKTKNVDIDVQKLKKGIYILKVINGQYVETHRIVVN